MVRPGCLIGGEISTLVDRGYQKFLRTSKLEVAATAAHLHALHAFDEELCEAIGTPDYYNLALGTVSDLYLYDRLKGREAAQSTARHALTVIPVPLRESFYLRRPCSRCHSR